MGVSSQREPLTGGRGDGIITHLPHIPKIQVSVGELFPKTHVQGDLGVVIVIGEVQILAHGVFHHESLVAVQRAPAAVWIQQLRDGLEVAFTEGGDEPFIEPELVQEDLKKHTAMR